MNIIGDLIKSPCTFLVKIPFKVKSYSEVIKIWILFLNGKTLSYEISKFFNIHLVRKNHVILYNSKGKLNSLLLCFINGIYINLLIPNFGLKDSCIAIWF